MSYIKVPSWLDLVKLGSAIGRLGPLMSFKNTHEQSFWKEQSLRFGFDIREALGLSRMDIRWESFFHEKFFQYTLKRVDYALDNLKYSEKAFWKRNGRFIEHLELPQVSQQDLEVMLSWFPSLSRLVLRKSNTLLQSDTPIISNLKRLHTLEIHDSHLVSEKAFANIPNSIQKLVIHSAKSITDSFFEKLKELKALQILWLQNCSSLQLHQLSKLPLGLLELDISGSGKNIMPDACFYLPMSLVTLKMNRWDHFGDLEITSLPQHLATLEIEGWQISTKGFERLSQMPLISLNISRVQCDTFKEGLQFLPKSLRKLNISQNTLKADQLSSLQQLIELEELDLSYTQGYEGTLEDAPLQLPNSLTTLNLSYSSPLHRETIRSFKDLNNLKNLTLSGCMLENSDLEWLPNSLEQLDLSLCTKITDVGLILLESLKALSKLYLDGCEQIRGFGFSHLSSSIKNISLAGCHRLSGKSLVQLPKELEELSLDSCELVMLEDIQTLPLTLHVLSLSRCTHIGNEACDYLSSLPLLNTISLQGCPKITEVAIAKLIRRKFEGTIIIKTDLPINKSHVKEAGDIELHPPVSILRKLTNFKARLIHKLNMQKLG